MPELEVSVIIPCLNEEATIAICVEKALKSFQALGLSGEVIVSDNGSLDKSVEKAVAAGAKVVYQPARGYGNAFLKGLNQARGRFIILADGDDTYDLTQLEPFVKKLKDGYDFVLGSRFKGRILPGAMSWSHRYIGNPILTGFLNLFFNSKISDAHCGFRAITKDALDRIKLKTGGMEFASEMVIEALRSKLKVAEVPITYYVRKGKSKLSSFPDAWRHMRFMLLYSPTYLFLLPGGFLFVLGGAAGLVFLSDSVSFLGHKFDAHAMALAAFINILGFQILNLGLYAKTYAYLAGFEKNNFLDRFYRIFNLEKGIFYGLFSFFLGFLTGLYVLYDWSRTGFQALDAVKLALFSLTAMLIGVQIIFSSFFLSLIGIQMGRRD